MPVATLMAEHRRILRNVEALEVMVALPRPDRVHGLSDKRWAFTRDLMLHFSHVESWIHAPLLADPRPELVEAALASRCETRALVADFRAHAARWHGFPPAEQWGEYGLVVDHLMSRIRARLARQESDLYTLLPERPSTERIAEPALNYASKAWKIRQLIYRDNGTPVVEQQGTAQAR